MNWSYSKLDVYLKCPYRFKLQYISLIPVPETSPLRIGSAIHDFMHHYGCICTQSGNATDLERGKEIMDANARTLPPEDIEDFTDIAQKILDTYSFELSSDRKFFFEQKFAFDKNWTIVAWEDPDVRFRAILDRYEEGKEEISVVDYKTDRRIRTISEVKNDTQLKIYAFILALLYKDKGIHKIRVSLDFVRYGKKIGPFEFSTEKLMDIGTYIDKLINNAEKDKKYPARIGEHCDFCPYVGKCHLYSEASMDVLEGATPEAMAEWMFKEEIKLKVVKTRLKSLIESQGKKFLVGNMELNFHEKIKRQIIDVQELVAKLVNAGVPRETIWDGLNASRSKLEKALRKFDSVKKLLDEHTEEINYTEFGFKKIDEAPKKVESMPTPELCPEAEAKDTREIDLDE